MSGRDWKELSQFGMDYATPGVLGGLGQGYVQPNLMYFGNSAWDSDMESFLRVLRRTSEEELIRIKRSLG